MHRTRNWFFLRARPYLEDYDLQKVGSGPLQYVYTLPVPLASPYYLADSSYWPNKGDFYKKGQPPSKDYYHRDFSQTWPAIKGDHPEKEKWPGKGDHHQKRVHVNGARVLEDDSMLSAKNSSGVGLSPLNKTTSTNIHEQSDSQDTVAIVSGQSQHRPIGGAQPHRGHAHQNDRTSPLRDPLQIDAANLKNLHKASYTVAAHGPVTEAAVSQTDRAIMDTSAGERLIWRPKATPPEYDRPMTGHPVLVRQHHVQEAPAYYTLPVKRFLYMPDTHNARARRPGTERVLIKAGGDTFLL
nr:hypothetical protein BaRGS_024481 [Batillaria attramentaria]